MPARGSYQITSREEGRAAERDESYRSCIISMLIFILLCIVIIVASWPWRKWHIDDNAFEKDSKGTARIEGEGFSTVTDDPEIEVDRETRVPVKNDHFERYSNNASTKSEVYARTTEEYRKTKEKEAELLTIFSTSMSTHEYERTDKSSLEEVLSSSTEAITASSEKLDIETTERSSTTEENFSTELFGRIRDSTKKAETTRRPHEDYTSLQRLLVGKYFGNESTASTNEDSGENWLDEVQEQSTHEPEKFMQSSEAPKSRSSPVNRISATTSINSKVTSSASTVTEIKTSTPSSIIKETNSSRHEKINICETGSCKQLASKMLSFMNHSADPCDDFYEYACGGLEADPQINEKDLSQGVYETIALQAHDKRENPDYANFNKYYESCLKYEISFDKQQRLKLAKEALSKVGNFYTSVTWPGNSQDFTQLFANMLLNNGPLLFDIVPDMNETNPEAFTLKIGPAINKSPFQFANFHDLCDDDSEQALKDHVNLDQLYERYTSCKNDSRNLVTSITHALKELAIFDDLENPYNISQYLDGTTINIDLEIIKGILPKFPSQSEIVEAYRSKRYTVTTLSQFEADCKLLNWSKLITLLTGIKLGPNAQLQVYYKRELIAAFQHLHRFSFTNKFELNNALLGLYARNLYQDFVAPRSSSNLEKHCLYTATHFLEREASQLYMSSFAVDKIENMKAMIKRLFHELKETLKLQLEQSEWAVEWGRRVLLKKLSDMKISLPDPSYLKKTDANTLNMTDNYFENSLTLMKKYRSMIYSVLQKNADDPEIIWTFFASPFQSITETIYGLNLIVIPYGAIDWPIVSRNGESFDYLVQATVGNVIAREIARNFDMNGIRYWNGSHDSEFALMVDGDLTKTTFEDYIDCQRNSIYQQPIEISLPATGQRVSFTIPPLTLNDRLSDAVGMRLAHDTLARLNSIASDKRLPWLDLETSQLFHLAYAQTHCTKAPLTSSYVSLYEDESLPSRIRIFVIATNNKILGQAWRCPVGSQVLPEFTCGVFPHLENRANAPDAA